MSLFSWGMCSREEAEIRHQTALMNKSMVSGGIIRDRACGSGKAFTDRMVKGASIQTTWAHRERI